MLSETLKAVNKIKAQIEAEGGQVNVASLDIKKLLKDVQAEFDCGCCGSVYDVIVDLNDTVGLDEYGIVITG
jgi:hypothetical protein